MKLGQWGIALAVFILSFGTTAQADDFSDCYEAAKQVRPS